ncbi:MAG: DUF721 domain-containing protein [Treponema sp.]|jgi:hypothetical protein|nr:DUF721 domain-containing protein [Treponema sp.]
MKKAGDVLSAFFDERLMKKAQGYSKFFDSWTDITEKNGIAAAADHSRIKELEKGIILIEADHPGWKQILQTKQTKILNDFRRRFPELDISGISLMLSRDGPPPEADHSVQTGETAAATPEATPQELPFSPNSGDSGYNGIKDGDFKESLKRLEHSIAANEKPRAKKR